MKVKQLTLEQMRRIYDDFFPEAFPQNEIRPWENLKGHWDNALSLIHLSEPTTP